MGASNFARGNTSKVFAVLMNTEEKYSKCSECDEKNFEWEEKETQKMVEVIENVFTEVSQPLNVVATFSNGETIYEKTN